MDEDVEVQGELIVQVSLFCGGTTRRLMILPILSGFGSKLLGRSKPVIEASPHKRRLKSDTISVPGG